MQSVGFSRHNVFIQLLWCTISVFLLPPCLQGADRFYVFADLGVNLAHDIRSEVQTTYIFTPGGRPVPASYPSTELEMEPGVRGTLGFGFRLLPYLAAEAEIGYSENQTKRSIVLGQGPSVNAEAWFTIIPYTLGLNWQLPPEPAAGHEQRSLFRRLKPFVGAGFGAATVFGDFDRWSESARGRSELEHKGNDTVPAYYAKAGITYPIGDHWELGTQYRVWGLPRGFRIEGTDTDNVLSHTLSLILAAEF